MLLRQNELRVNDQGVADLSWGPVQFKQGQIHVANFGIDKVDQKTQI